MNTDQLVYLTPRNDILAKTRTIHISYNPDSVGYGCDTTAIVLAGRVFFILNGRHQIDLDNLDEINAMQCCVDYFIKNMDKTNSKSEHLMATNLLDDPFKLYNTTLEVIGQNNINLIIIQAIKLNPSLADKFKSQPTNNTSTLI